MGRLAKLALAILLTAAFAISGRAETGPAPGPVRVIGSNGAGCIAGAVELPPEGLGFQEIRFRHSVFWGHPRTIALLELLGQRAHAAGLPDLYIDEISTPRGGPNPGHAGHQLGLEADVWLDVSPKPVLTREQRQEIEVPSVVRPDGRAVDPAIWTEDHARLLRLAALLPDVDRIFVNPAIKQQLCQATTGDRSWLRLIRPWWGHAAHFHIRFRCPAGQTECVQGPPPPPGDGCDASLRWWFDQLDQPPKPPAPPHAPPALPAACRAIMDAPPAPARH